MSFNCYRFFISRIALLISSFQRFMDSSFPLYLHHKQTRCHKLVNLLRISLFLHLFLPSFHSTCIDWKKRVVKFDRNETGGSLIRVWKKLNYRFVYESGSFNDIRNNFRKGSKRFCSPTCRITRCIRSQTPGRDTEHPSRGASAWGRPAPANSKPSSLEKPDSRSSLSTVKSLAPVGSRPWDSPR